MSPEARIRTPRTLKIMRKHDEFLAFRENHVFHFKTQKRSPEPPKILPKAPQMSPRGSPNESQSLPEAPQMSPKASRDLPKWPQMLSQGPPSHPICGSRLQKLCSEAPFGPPEAHFLWKKGDKSPTLQNHRQQSPHKRCQAHLRMIRTPLPRRNVRSTVNPPRHTQHCFSKRSVT